MRSYTQEGLHVIYAIPVWPGHKNARRYSIYGHCGYF